MIVSLLHSSYQPKTNTTKTVEPGKSAPLQPSLDHGQNLDSPIPTPTRLILSAGEVPHLEFLRCGNQSIHRRPPSRHFPMSASDIHVRQNHPRKMHQPRRILRLNRSAEPLHRHDGPLNPHNHHRAPPNAPPAQDRRMHHPMYGYSASDPQVQLLRTNL
jgi:hypothetical protein